MSRKKRETHETKFERAIGRVSPQLGCVYTHIPDVIPALAELVRKRQVDQYKTTNVALPRPCDAVFSSFDGNLFVEAKYDKNQLTVRQKEFGKKIERLNGLFVVVRKKESIKNNKLKITYRIENTNRKVYHECSDIGEMINELKKIIKSGGRDA